VGCLSWCSCKNQRVFLLIWDYFHLGALKVFILLGVHWMIMPLLAKWFSSSSRSASIMLVLTHFEHLKTFIEIQSHLKTEEECLKMFGTNNVALITRGNRRKDNKNN